MTATSSEAKPVGPRHGGRRDHWQYFVEGAIAVINVVALFAGLSLCAGLEGPQQIWLAAILVLFGPGSGLVQLIGPFDTTVRVSLVVGLSVAVSTVVGQILLTVGSIGVLQGAIPLTVITGAGLIIRLIRMVNNSGSDTEASS